LLFDSICQHFCLLETATCFNCFLLFLKYRCSLPFKCKVVSFNLSHYYCSGTGLTDFAGSRREKIILLL